MMTKKYYRDGSISAVLMTDGGRVFLLEMTLWRDSFKCDRFRKIADLYVAGGKNNGSFGFTVTTIIDDMNGLDTHEKDLHDIWITDMFPQLKGLVLYSVASAGKNTFTATVVENEYFKEEYSK